MARELPVRTDWQRQVVATRTMRGQVYVLLSIHKTTCDACRYGVHFDTLWGSTGGDACRVTWCGSCFNADCAWVELDEDTRARWQGLVQRASAQPALPCWNAARPAIEDLERRGLV